MLFLTCIFRLRIQPFVPFSDIADIFLQTLSARLSSLPGTWMKRCKHYLSFLGKLSLVSPSEFHGVPGMMSGCLFYQLGLVQFLEDNFKGTEFRGDQIWCRAKHVDAELVREMVRAAKLDEKGYTLAEAAEMELQIRWRRNGDWRAGSIPDGEGIVQPGVGAIGDRQR
jgi:hypothetical protein